MHKSVRSTAGAGESPARRAECGKIAMQFAHRLGFLHRNNANWPIEIDGLLYERQDWDLFSVALVLLCHKRSFALALPQQGHCPRRAISR
jgi:hypothetical protein